MAIIGAHSVVYSTDPEADRAFLRDVLQFPNVDVGGGWLIFGLPPAEVAVHPGENNSVHEFFLMCDDIQAFVAEMQDKGRTCDPVQAQPWGALTHVTLPGGGKLGVYQPRHARPDAMGSKRAAKPTRRTAAKKAARKAAKKAAPGKKAAKRAKQKTKRGR
jgi:hypothetical protein